MDLILSNAIKITSIFLSGSNSIITFTSFATTRTTAALILKYSLIPKYRQKFSVWQNMPQNTGKVIAKQSDTGL